MCSYRIKKKIVGPFVWTLLSDGAYSDRASWCPRYTTCETTYNTKAQVKGQEGPSTRVLVAGNEKPEPELSRWKAGPPGYDQLREGVNLPSGPCNESSVAVECFFCVPEDMVIHGSPMYHIHDT